MIITGLGGSITKDAVAIANVTSFTFKESEGTVYGQKQSDISLTALAVSDALPMRQGDIFDLVLDAATAATWDITITDAKITDVSFSVDVNKAVNYSVQFVSQVKAVIA